MAERILITGITGFAGSHLADLMLEKGNTVYGLKRWNLSRMRNVKDILEKIQWIDCDITDPISVKKALNISKPDIFLGAASDSPSKTIGNILIKIRENFLAIKVILRKD